MLFRKSVAVQSDQESLWLATLTDAERRNVREISSSPLMPTPDLLVLGGGIVGLATAYFAATQGLKVQVLTDSDAFGSDAEYSLGCIVPNVCRWQFAPITQQMAQSSRDWWAKLAVRPEFQIDWRVCGALMVDAQRLAPSPRLHMLAALDEGYSVHDIDAEQVALLEPALSPLALGGLHYPSEAHLHPLKAASGFITGLTRRGAHITKVDVISSAHVEAQRVMEVQTSSGTARPKAIFCDDHNLLAELLGDQARFSGLILTRQQFLATEPTSPLLKRPLLDAHWIVQLKSGEVLMAIPINDPADGRVESAVERARQLIPALRDVPFTRSWTGSSQRSPEATPVVENISNFENVWSSGGLDFAEVLFAPMIGKAVTEWIQIKDVMPGNR